MPKYRFVTITRYFYPYGHLVAKVSRYTEADTHVSNYKPSESSKNRLVSLVNRLDCKIEIEDDDITVVASSIKA